MIEAQCYHIVEWMENFLVVRLWQHNSLAELDQHQEVLFSQSSSQVSVVEAVEEFVGNMMVRWILSVFVILEMVSSLVVKAWSVRIIAVDAVFVRNTHRLVSQLWNQNLKIPKIVQYRL